CVVGWCGVAGDLHPFPTRRSSDLSGAPDELIRRVEAALAAGARLLQLRDPRLERARFCALARALAARCRRAGARLLVNAEPSWLDRKSTRLNSSHVKISYAVLCLK